MHANGGDGSINEWCQPTDCRTFMVDIDWSLIICDWHGVYGGCTLHLAAAEQGDNAENRSRIHDPCSGAEIPCTDVLSPIFLI